jgi:hypothetical protein
LWNCLRDGCGELVVCGGDLRIVRTENAKRLTAVTYGRTAQAGDFGDGRRKLEYGGLVRGHVIALREPVIE